MNQGYRSPRNDFEVIEKFDSYEDDDLAVNMIEFYQEQRDRNIPLENAYFKTLQTYNTTPNTTNSTNPNVNNPEVLQYVF